MIMIMSNFPCRGLRVVVACVLVMALVSAQLTFSRDWTGGKRSSSVSFDCAQFAKLCRHFIHDIKSSLTSEKLNKHRKAQRDNRAVIMDYDDEK